MSSSINWTGNKVLDPNAARKAAAAAIHDDARKTAVVPTAPVVPAVTEKMTEPVVATIPTQQGILTDTQQGPPPSTEKGYIPYYLTQNIGKNVRAEFVIGSDRYADKTGKLAEVGINYFVLYDVNSRTNIMCDLYSVKFVTILLS